jgi:microtubule-associated serine/threonine kinase
LLIKSLASGAYGKVILSRKKNTKDMFAIKVLEMDKMREKNVVDTIINEQNILNNIDCDYIARGVYTFKSHKYLYMVMNYMKGGDLENLLEEYGYFSVDMAKNYIAQLVLALE